jgi:proteasome lid subunit RPN8/RPN11
VKLISVQPDSPLHGLEGLKDMASAMVPAIYDPDLADEDLRITTEDGHRVARRLAREAGVATGPSGGAAVAAAVRIAARLDRGVVVTILPDGGERYLSERFWDELDAAPATPPLVLSHEVARSIRAHGEATYPEECCGALLGDADGHVREAFPLGNTMDAERRRRFLIGPGEYREAEARATATDRALVGFYHSHPDHPARPSAFDLEHAWPNMSYVIVSVHQGRSDELRSWRLAADRSQFDEELVARPATGS